MSVQDRFDRIYTYIFLLLLLPILSLVDAQEDQVTYDPIKVFFIIRKKSLQQTEKEVTSITGKLTPYLHEHHGVPPKSLNMIQFSHSLEGLFNERYMTCSLSYLHQCHMRNDIKLIHSIKRKLHKSACIIRVSDKSGVFHIGSKSDYERKVALYQEKTEAYVELLSNPLMEIFYKVVRLLNDLNSKKQIPVWQYRQMMPNKEKMKLAYLYFIPKSHKVFFVFLEYFLDFLHMCIFVHLGRYTTTTYCVIYRCTNNWNIKNVRSLNSTIVR